MALPFYEINETLAQWASNTPLILDFTVENILYANGLSSDGYDEVYRFLMGKVGFELIAKKIILCPNNHKCDEFLLDEPVDEDYFDCHCGEIDFEPENFLLAFSFTDGFRNGALKKKINYRLDLQMV